MTMALPPPTGETIKYGYEHSSWCAFFRVDRRQGKRSMRLRPPASSQENTVLELSWRYECAHAVAPRPRDRPLNVTRTFVSALA